MQTDIEIYVMSCPTEKIISWIKSHSFNVIETKNPSSLCSKLITTFNDQKIEVTILQEAAGKRFTSIWFDSDKTPWDSDMDCAKQAFDHLQCEVRCNFQGWEEEGNQDPDQWWRINSHDEGPFIWS